LAPVSSSTRARYSRSLGRLLAKGQQRVAKQCRGAGDGALQYGKKFQFISARVQQMLPQAEQQQTQLMLHFHAVQVHGNLQIRDDVSSEEHAVRALHIQALDREHIGRAL